MCRGKKDFENLTDVYLDAVFFPNMRKEEKIADYFKHPRAWFCILTVLASIGLLIWLVVKVNALATL